MKSKSLVLTIVGILVLGGFFLILASSTNVENIKKQKKDAEIPNISSIEVKTEPITGITNNNNADVKSISIINFKFVPKNITVKAGTKIIWTNKDGVGHTVTSNSKIFESRLLQKGESFEYTFTKPGTYPYYCIPHPFMTATITVE